MNLDFFYAFFYGICMQSFSLEKLNTLSHENNHTYYKRNAIRS